MSPVCVPADSGRGERIFAELAPALPPLWLRAALPLAWVCGVAAQLAQPVCWPWPGYAAMAAGGVIVLLACGLLGRRAGRWPPASARVLAMPVGATAADSGGLVHAERRGCPSRLRRLLRGSRGSRLASVVRPMALCLALAAAGFGNAGLRACRQLADALAPAWENRPIELQGIVDEMPQVREDGVQFAFAVEAAQGVLADGRSVELRAGPGSDQVPGRVRLAWYRPSREDPSAGAGVPAVRAGQRWVLPVRLRRPHGAANPQGFDAELWLFEQGVRATGTVQGEGRWVADTWAPIERARQAVRDRLLLHGLPEAEAGTLAALVAGDQAAIPPADWETYRDAGVAHLMSISGMHITMLAWLAAAAVAALWRRHPRAVLRVPAVRAGRWGGVAVAWMYALFAGWGVPAQRTVWMLAGCTALRDLGVDWPAPLVTLAAMVPVTCLDPWALLQPGYWLSFAAVTWLMVSQPVREAPALPAAPTQANDVLEPAETSFGRRLAGALLRQLARLGPMLKEGLRAQTIAVIGLAPLTLVFFRQFSLAGWAANVVAEPWVTLVVVPLGLAGIVCPPLWSLAGVLLAPLRAWLAWLAGLPLASIHVAAPPLWITLAGLAGGALLMLPLPVRLRLLGLPLAVPLAAPHVERPEVGRFELVALDVGQGSAVLVRTREHLLVFDTGPRFGESGDAGQRMLVPLLQARGERAVDLLMLSHGDADHVGGAASLLARWPVHAMQTSLPPGHPLLRRGVPHLACEAGRRWAWDGVTFTTLFPEAPGPSGASSGARPNARSCVLHVADAQGRAALLTGDIEAAQESRLVAQTAPALLRADVLLVPHHGSRTSSTAALIAAVRPAVAVMQLGYLNRYGHPAGEVMQRYRDAGVEVVRSDSCGAWQWRDGQGACVRAQAPRYWQWQP